MKIRILALLCVLLLTLSGCDLLMPKAEGTLSVDANSVSVLQVEGALSGKSFSIQNRESIRRIVNLINSLMLDTAAEETGDSIYSIVLSASDGSEVLSVLLHSRDTLSTPDGSYSVDCEELWNAIAKEECATLTDAELLRSIFADSYWDGISITNDKGDISVDKILGIPDQFPALFELLGRPTMLSSVANEGLSLIREYANSTSQALRDRAEKLGSILSNLIPSMKDQIEDILETSPK